MIISLENLPNIPLTPNIGDIIYITGDLAAGKTTLVQHLLERFGIPGSQVKSPTYTYYQQYIGSGGEMIYHFDLYRITDYDIFVNIGGQEILENPHHICFIEWPEILGDRFNRVRRVSINKTTDSNTRDISWDY
jgi:tRNA threonylcarbamoyl adenosine modification protein YjeE